MASLRVDGRTSRSDLLVDDDRAVEAADLIGFRVDGGVGRDSCALKVSIRSTPDSRVAGLYEVWARLRAALDGAQTGSARLPFTCAAACLLPGHQRERYWVSDLKPRLTSRVSDHSLLRTGVDGGFHSTEG